MMQGVDVVRATTPHPTVGLWFCQNCMMKVDETKPWLFNLYMEGAVN